MSELISHLQSEWTTLTSAPVTFALLVVVSLGAALVAARWRYEAVIGHLREQVKTYKSRLEAKDDQLGSYRERLHLAPADQTAYSQLTNAELQDKALDLVQRMREFVHDRQSRSSAMPHSEKLLRPPSMSEEERQRVWREATNAMKRDSLERNAKYDHRFKVDSILLRDELLSRLPANSKDETAYSMYEHPTNPIGMGRVADDLERMAKSLPRRTGV